MKSSAPARHGKLAASVWLAAAAALLCSVPAAHAQLRFELGPKVLYPGVQAIASNASIPLQMRDAIQSIVLGSRLLAVRPRILGGDPVAIGMYPWMASIGLTGASPRDGHFCAGAFIAPNWVLTAAQCVNSDVVGKIQVVNAVGELEKGTTIYPVDRVVVHENYDLDRLDYDVALVHVTKAFSGPTLRLIDRARAGTLLIPGSLGVATGWGIGADGLQVSNILRHVVVQAVSNLSCNGLAAYSGAVTERMICAGFPEGGRDSCQGDTGTPLVVPDRAGGFFLGGILSWGEGCARPNKFGVYTRSEPVTDWIKDRLAGKPQPPRQAKPQVAQTNTSGRGATDMPMQTAMQTRSANVPAGSPQQGLQLGPRSLYPRTAAAQNGTPLVMRDALQYLQNRTRLLAIKPRIMGGEAAPPTAYPFMASISVRNSNPRDGHFCGGSFIAADWVLTAAHCVKPEQAANIQVYGGSNQLSSGGRVYGVSRIIVHEGYDTITQENDVALLQLTQRASVASVQPLPADDAQLAAGGRNATAIGWGYTAEGGDVQNVLRRVALQIVSNDACNAPGAYAGGITAGMLCAGFRAGGKDSCQGDSGGPLVVSNGNGTFYQAGVVSWGEGCGQPNKYGVYTRVSAYRSWIADRVAGRAVTAAPTAAPATRAIVPAPQAEPASPRLRNGVPSNSRAEVVMKKKIGGRAASKSARRSVIAQ